MSYLLLLCTLLFIETLITIYYPNYCIGLYSNYKKLLKFLLPTSAIQLNDESQIIGINLNEDIFACYMIVVCFYLQICIWTGRI